MLKRFQECLKFVLKWEGGYTNHPADPGGATNMGITQKVYDLYRKSKGLPRQSVKHITQAEVADIYFFHYWLPSLAPALPAPLDLVIFDTAVNMGLGGAHKVFNKAFGKNLKSFATLTEIAKMSPEQLKALCETCIAKRKERYMEIVKANPKLKVFLKGWLNRLEDLRKTALGLK